MVLKHSVYCLISGYFGLDFINQDSEGLLKSQVPQYGKFYLAVLLVSYYFSTFEKYFEYLYIIYINNTPVGHIP